MSCIVMYKSVPDTSESTAATSTPSKRHKKVPEQGDDMIMYQLLK